MAVMAFPRNKLRLIRDLCTRRAEEVRAARDGLASCPAETRLQAQLASHACCYLSLPRAVTGSLCPAPSPCQL
jgi:hypothetical protein